MLAGGLVGAVREHLHVLGLCESVRVGWKVTGVVIVVAAHKQLRALGLRRLQGSKVCGFANES